jgi:hypothetical protein
MSDAMSDAEIASAVRLAIEGHPEGTEAGPAAIRTALQAKDERFASFGLQKFKKVYAKVKAQIVEDAEQAKIEAGKPKVGSAENCPGKHGLQRFTTTHASYCCDVCRCYLAQGAPMWGCRQCDWDVCEGRCHPAYKTLEDLKASFKGLESQVNDLRAEETSDVKTRLAQVEVDVHKLEKSLDNTSVQELCKASVLQLKEENVRNEKKALIRSTEALLQDIEVIFAKLKLNSS